MNEIRCHFSMFITRTLKTAWAVIAALIAFLLQSGSGDELLRTFSRWQILIFVAMLTLLLVILIFNFLRWRRTFITINDENVIVDRRTINKNKTTVKISTISSVNLKQGILEKLFGTYRLQLDINSSATADKTDFDLVFTKEQAKAIRAMIIGREEVVAAAQTDMPTVDENAEYVPSQLASGGELICQFSFGQVVRHCLLGLSITSLVAATFGFLIWLWSANLGAGKVSWIPILVAVFPAVYQLIKPFFLYQNFKVVKRGKYLDVSYGMIVTQHFSLPLDKTNAIIINRPVLARIFNLCCGEIINVGMGDSESNQAPVFCLLTTPRQMHEIILAIAPGYAPSAEVGEARPHQRSPRQALWPVMAHWLICGLIAAAVALIFGKIILAVILMAFAVLSGYLSWRTKEMALFADKISISSGVFAKRNITVEYGRLQRLMRKTNPLSRRFHLAHGNLSILATAINQSNHIGYFDESHFDRIEEEIMLSVQAKNKQKVPR